MNTPEYIANMKKKQFLYQRDRKKLISIYYNDFERIEEILQLKLSRYIRIDDSSLPASDYASTSS